MANAFHAKRKLDDCPKNLNAPACPLYGGKKPDTKPLDAGPYGHLSALDRKGMGGEIGTCPVPGCGHSVVYDATGKPLRAKKPS
jgi:hypothetical protein